MQSCLLVFNVCLIKNSKSNQMLKSMPRQYSDATTKCTMESPVVYFSSWSPPPTQIRFKGRGENNIMLGAVVKEKMGRLEENIREVFIRILMKGFNVMVGKLIGKKR